MEPANEGGAAGLSARELAMLRQRLEGARDELTARLARDEAAALQADSLPEPMDAAELTREQDDGVTFASRDRVLLREIDQALARIAAGTYGVSELSGQPIGLRRLQALPWTRLTAAEAETR